MNIHADYLDKRIRDFENQLHKWNVFVIGTDEDILRDFNTCVFTNLVKQTITISYMKKHPCEDCGMPRSGRFCFIAGFRNCSEQRCHGLGEERSVLLKRALMKVHPDANKPLLLRTLVIAFLDEHKYSNFALKCTPCHKRETEMLRNRNREINAL
jgi:hypothetical protein